MRSRPTRFGCGGLAGGALTGGGTGLATAVLGRTLDSGLFLLPDSPLLAYGIMIVIGAGLGAGFGLFVRRTRFGVGEFMFWGLSYGILWWVLGRLTLVPWILDRAFAWDLSAAQATFPDLIGLALYGSLMGLLFALFLLTQERVASPRPSGLLFGLISGLFSAWVLGGLLQTQEHLVPMGAMTPGTSPDERHLGAWVIVLLIGALAGTIYAALYPEPVGGAGVSSIRGTLYGFIFWILGALTILPLLAGGGVGWSLEHVRAEFPTLPGFLLFGSFLTLLYRAMHRLRRFLVSVEVPRPRFEGPGVRIVRALGRGAVAGLIGGGVFTLIMLQIDFFPRVASLIGSTSPRAGVLVHFGFAVVIGMSYGILFRRQTFDLTSALGWGLAYGFLWWILGPLTLMPVFLGSMPQWDVAPVAATFPALVGHLAYGSALGITFYALEARDRPWWLSRSESEATRIAQHKSQSLSSAPAIWVTIVMVALILPVLLGMG